VARNTIYFGVLVLTIRTRHFPIDYEGAHGVEIGADEWIQGLINRILNVFTGQVNEILMVLSSSACFSPMRPRIGTTT
jgi:hypothetical protein